jgi:hypothetical protein
MPGTPQSVRLGTLGENLMTREESYRKAVTQVLVVPSAFDGLGAGCGAVLAGSWRYCAWIESSILRRPRDVVIEDDISRFQKHGVRYADFAVDPHIQAKLGDPELPAKRVIAAADVGGTLQHLALEAEHGSGAVQVPCQLFGILMCLVVEHDLALAWQIAIGTTEEPVSTSEATASLRC